MLYKCSLYFFSGVFLFIMMRIDKAIYGEWTLVPLNFFYFNVSKRISHIYGRCLLSMISYCLSSSPLIAVSTIAGTHSWHWYLTQCLPFVLSAHLILLLLGWKRCKNRTLQVIIVWTILVYRYSFYKLCTYAGQSDLRSISESAVNRKILYVPLNLLYSRTR